MRREVRERKRRGSAFLKFGGWPAGGRSERERGRWGIGITGRYREERDGGGKGGRALCRTGKCFLYPKVILICYYFMNQEKWQLSVSGCCCVSSPSSTFASSSALLFPIPFPFLFSTFPQLLQFGSRTVLLLRLACWSGNGLKIALCRSKKRDFGNNFSAGDYGDRP